MTFVLRGGFCLGLCLSLLAMAGRREIVTSSPSGKATIFCEFSWANFCKMHFSQQNIYFKYIYIYINFAIYNFFFYKTNFLPPGDIYEWQTKLATFRRFFLKFCQISLSFFFLLVKTRRERWTPWRLNRQISRQSCQISRKLSK